MYIYIGGGCSIPRSVRAMTRRSKEIGLACPRGIPVLHVSESLASCKLTQQSIVIDI